MKEKQKLNSNQNRRNRLFQISIIIILILLLTPSNGKYSVNYIDKLVHFSLFMVLSINICYKYQKDKIRFEAIIWAIFFGLLTEVIQQFIPGRDMDIYDGIADTLCVIAGYYIYLNNHFKLDKIILKLGA